MEFKEKVESWFKEFQDRLCQDLEQCDGKAKFAEDLWERPGGGGGRSRVIENGNVLEKGGVNFSAVTGTLPEPIAKELLLPNPDYFATGVSVVLHPGNPMIPIIHMNVRYFESGSGYSWFGGGIDLTPIYINKEQASFFHNSLKTVCDKHDPNYYTDYKKWADDYFFIPHRNETRGIGGIFFDRLAATNDKSREMLFDFVKDVANTFAPVYTTIVNQNRNLAFTEQEKEWQLMRRGRYVEFNLVYDRGTKFGLHTQGRTESILMSLPNLASWKYNFQPVAGSKEEETLNLLKKGIDWVNG